MRSYVSEGRAVYEDYNHGQFSKSLAEFAVSNMKVRENGRMVPIKRVSIDELRGILKNHGVEIEERMIYTALYLYNMAIADYQKSLKDDTARCNFVVETLLDHDCCPEAVLECYTAKMCALGIPIHWEDHL